ncbi:hypothetical protein PAMP_008313 [Pampus punctatissimus]
MSVSSFLSRYNNLQFSKCYVKHDRRNIISLFMNRGGNISANRKYVSWYVAWNHMGKLCIGNIYSREVNGSFIALYRHDFTKEPECCRERVVGIVEKETQEVTGSEIQANVKAGKRLESL